MARGLVVKYAGDNSDIVLIESSRGTVAADLTLDKLHEHKISDNKTVAAVHCGINHGGDGVLLYGLYWRKDPLTGIEKAHCDGVLSFVPVDHFLDLSEVVSDGQNGAYVKVITGQQRDVYTQLHWDSMARKWSATTQYYKGWVAPVILIPLGRTVSTLSGEDAPGYTATYLNLRTPQEHKKYFPSWSNLLDWQTFPYGKRRS